MATDSSGRPGWVDIHSHLLSGIDDGPGDLKESLAMARRAVQTGIATMALTPHVRADFPLVRVQELAGRAAELARELERHGIPLTVLQGAEVSLDWALDADDAHLRAASFGGAGRDLLIETPDQSAMIGDVLHEVRARGYRVTLAHPERSARFQFDPRRVQALVEQGVILQVNAAALLGPERATRRLAEHLCTHGLASVIASDSHRAERWRPVTELSSGIEALTALVGSERATWMARAAPAAVLAGEALPPAPAPLAGGLMRRLLRRW